MTSVDFELKRLSADGLQAAIKKAEHYRLLNEPRQAESICLDLLELDAGNQPALILLLLARTDQFVREVGARVEHARGLLERIHGQYEQAYFGGIICERWAKAQLSRANPGCGALAYHWLRDAMELYEKAESLRPTGNDDPLLRWNACARLIMRHDYVAPGAEDDFHPFLE